MENLNYSSTGLSLDAVRQFAETNGIVYIDLKNDYAFKFAFGREGCEGNLMVLLRSILPEKKIQSLILLPQEQLGDLPDKRKVIYDILCESEDGSRFTVEMQMSKMEDFADRMILYSSFPIRNHFLKGVKSYFLPEIYVIGILDFLMPNVEPNDKVINHFQIRNESGALMSKSIHYITVELPKLQREIPEDVQDNERVLYLIDRQGGLKEIPRQLQGHGLDNIVNMSIFASMSENNQKEYVFYMMDELDSMSKIRTAKNDGKAEGKAEGIAEGASAKSIEIAKAMLSKGIDVHTVAECTGLPVEQIVKLK